ncbi:hypothetical protein H4R35_003709 [Dimargaris xerosporica]|nr:hypothetical protein H4R35_003709 [Dimargaris xerosporica]
MSHFTTPTPAGSGSTPSPSVPQPPPGTTFENQVVTMLRTTHTEDMLMPDVSRVLVIYTGGTIGMKNTHNGYVPAPNYLASLLSRIERFHDPAAGPEDGPLSRTSSTGSLVDLVPVVGQRDAEQPDQLHTEHSRLAQIKSESAISAPPSHDTSSRAKAPATPPLWQADSAVAPQYYKTSPGSVVEAMSFSPWLITPRSIYGKRIKYRIMEYCPLLDSCNMTMAHWIQIASDIEAYYRLFDAFIILHGTDTMAYTASALSFLLEDLGKTVIITGSQIPISEVRNDAVENLLGALTIAGHFAIPEVTLYFSNTLFRGNRTSKCDAMDFNAFESPNIAPLVKVGVNIDVNWDEVLRPTAIAKFRAHRHMDPNVATLRLFPGITVAAVRAFLRPPIAGVVLETYGAGNAPSMRKDFVDALKEATSRGVVIVNCSQCKKGVVSDLYETAKPLLEANVVPGYDMTSELSYLLGRGYSPETCRALMMKSIRGELTSIDSHHGVGFHNRVHHFLQYLASTMFSPRSLPQPAAGTESSPSWHAAPKGGLLGALHSLTCSEADDIHHTQSTCTSDQPSHDAFVTTDERLAVEKSFFPILICAAAGSDDVRALQSLRQILGTRFHVNCIDYDGRTPLHLAASEGRVTACEFLLNNGASVHVLDHFGHTPLLDAVRKRSQPCVEMLVKAGALFNENERQEVAFRFHNAAVQGDTKAMSLFVLAGIDVNCPSFDDRTALHLAVGAAQTSSVRFLLRQPGIKVTRMDQWGHAALLDAHRLYNRMKQAQKSVRKLAALETIIQLLEDAEAPTNE